MSGSKSVIYGSHELVIQDYSLAKGIGIGNYLESDNFTVGGDEWAILFYPDGYSQEDESLFISVSINIRNKGTEYESGVVVFHELTLVDQSGKGNHEVQRFLEPSPEAAHFFPNTSVYTRFFKRSILETSDYLKDDRLIIRCKLGVVASNISQPHSLHVPDSDLASHFGVLMDCMEHSDVILDIAGQKFLAHKDELLKAVLGDSNSTWGAKSQSVWPGGRGDTNKPVSVLGKQLGSLLESGKGSDVVFRVDGEEFNAHKLFLSTRSPVFRAQFFGPWRDRHSKCITIKEMEAPIFKVMLHFIYCDELPDMRELVGGDSTPASTYLAQHLLVAADRYALERLKAICELKLCEGIDRDTVVTTLAVAELLSCRHLRLECLKFKALPGNMKS